MKALEKYENRAKKINSLLSIGLDPEYEKIPERFRALEFPQFEFNKFIIEETHGTAAAYKPNAAFYESRFIYASIIRISSPYSTRSAAISVRPTSITRKRFLTSLGLMLLLSSHTLARRRWNRF